MKSAVVRDPLRDIQSKFAKRGWPGWHCYYKSIPNRMEKTFYCQESFQGCVISYRKSESIHLYIYIGPIL